MIEGSRYSPFIKSLNEVEAGDLAQLRNAQEGWYIEYKSRLPNASALAKSVAAFANTYGGFLFIGIEEESKEHPVAGAFPGVTKSELAGALDSIRQAIAAHLSPPPHFETYSFSGPCEEIGLAEDRSVICIEVPWSPTAPHIHKSGVIFRRVADSSEPRAENERYILEELFKRSERRVGILKNLYDSDPILSENEANAPYVRLLMCTDPWRQQSPWLDHSISRFRELLNSREGDGIHVPFDNIYTTARGIVARQSKSSNPLNMSMTWFIDRDLTAELLIPLPNHFAYRPQDLTSVLSGYEHDRHFLDLLDEHRFENFSLIDLNQLIFILMGAFRSYHVLLDSVGWKSGYYVLPKILNTNRTIPFLDMKNIIESMSTHGVPVYFKMCADDFDFHHPKRYHPFEMAENGEPSHPTNAAAIFLSIAGYFGLPTLDLIQGNGDFYNNLMDAAERSLKNQAHRNELSQRQ